MNADTSDFEKLTTAVSSLTAISSFDDILEAFGLLSLPTAQRYGIMFGMLVFTFTVTAVITLLILGGSFKRIAEQSQTGGATIPDAVTARANRALLLERLLEARERMTRENYPEESEGGKIANGNGTSEKQRFTNLTKMLMNVAPSLEKVGEVSNLVSEEEKFKSKKAEKATASANEQQKREEILRCIPEGYEENYVTAYRKCQEKPGGNTLSGLPEARFEAYARAYAGCGVHTSRAYRRSYARMYESSACKTHGTEKKFSEHFQRRPQDLVGRTVRLEPLEVERHLQVIYDLTCGEAYLDNKEYSPNEVWGFLDCGPFKNPDELKMSPVFKREKNEAAFAVVESVTDRVLGVIILSNDEPQNLSIQLETPIVKPTSDGTVEQIEACFLLLDRLFAFGYRRVQLAVDAQHAEGKRLAGRLGFTQEGMIPKHMVVKESNRDSNIYGMLNSDWDKGARAFLFKKLHGAKAMRADEANNAKEGELDEQLRVLNEKKASAPEETAKNAQKQKH